MDYQCTPEQYGELIESEKKNAAIEPDHYKGKGPDCIEVARHLNFNRGNAFKYIYRAGSKGDVIEDLRKAIWYLDDEIKRLSATKPLPERY